MANSNFYNTGPSFYQLEDGSNFYDLDIDATTLANLPAPGDWRLRAWEDARVAYLLTQAPIARATTYFVDATSGDDTNDGRDAFGFALTDGAWTASTLTLTKTGAFASYTYRDNDRIYVSGGTGVTAGLYDIASKVSDDEITLATSIGPDAADVTTSDGPWETVAMVASNIGVNRAFLFKRGEVFRDTTGINVANANVTFAAYGYGPKPRITAFDAPVTTGASWTADAGTTYYRTRAGASPVGAFREAYDVERAYVRCSTVTECRLIKGSYFHDTGANRLYVNAYDGQNLTTAGLPYTFEICGVVEQDGISWTTASTGSLRCDNLIVEGFGSKDTVAAHNASYGIHTETTGTALTVCTDCECYYNNNHNFGHTSAGTGGIALFKDCKAAWMTYNGTCFVGYSSTTGNECYVVNCEAWGGTLPRNTAGTWSYTYAVSASDFYTAHSNGTVALSYVSKCRIRPNQFGLQGFGAAANVADCSSNIALCRSYMVDCEYIPRTPSALDQNLVVSAGRPGTNAIGLCPVNITDKNTTAHINCTYTLRPQWLTTNDVIGATDRIEGFFINCTFVADFSFVAHGDTSGAWSRGFVAYMLNSEARFYNCHFEMRLPQKLLGGMSSQCTFQNTLTDNNVDDDFYMFDTIFQIHAPNGTGYLGMGNNRLRADGSVHTTVHVKNIVTNVAPSTDTYRGNDKVENLIFGSLDIGQVPAIGEFDAAQNALPGGALYVRHDKFWKVRRTGTSAIGPVEAA